MTRRSLRSLLVSVCVLGSLIFPPVVDAHDSGAKVSGASVFWAGHPGALVRIIMPAPPAFAERLDELEAVWAEMVRAPWRSDLERLGIRDFWEATFDGDCEDKALAGLESLVERGWPRDAFGLFIRAGAEGRADHAILCVAILDPSGRSAASWCLDPLLGSIGKLSALPGPWRRAQQTTTASPAS